MKKVEKARHKEAQKVQNTLIDFDSSEPDSFRIVTERRRQKNVLVYG
jgi:hypothetical protein